MVMTVGYPLDLPITPNIGCVGGFGISSGNDRFFWVSHIRANVPVQRGEGGAPLLNMEGEVVGIVESSIEGAGCFVLPIEAAEKVRSDVIRFGEPRPGWLGIHFTKSDGSDSPIEVVGFLPDSPAEKAGIQPKDVILKVGDRTVSSPEDIMDAAFYLTAGDEVPVTVLRDGKPTEIKVQSAPNPLTAHQEVVSAPPVFNFSVHLGN
jgi:S1-C subfamily serine protease